MEFTFIDAFIIIVFFLSTYLAWTRGMVREVMSITGWIIAAAVGFVLAPYAQPLIAEIPGIGGILKNCELSTMAAFALAFGGSLIILGIFTPILSAAIHDSKLEHVDKGLGGAFGFVRAFFLIGLLFMLYDILIPPKDRISAVEKAATLELMKKARDSIKQVIPEEMPPILSNRISTLMDSCKKPPEPNPEDIKEADDNTNSENINSKQ